MQDIDAAEPLQHRGDRRLHRPGVGAVGLEGGRLDVRPLEQLNSLLGSSPAQVEHRHPGSLGADPLGGGAADAVPAARDDQHLVGESPAHPRSSSLFLAPASHHVLRWKSGSTSKATRLWERYSCIPEMPSSRPSPLSFQPPNAVSDCRT